MAAGSLHLRMHSASAAAACKGVVSLMGCLRSGFLGCSPCLKKGLASVHNAHNRGYVAFRVQVPK